MGLDYHKKYWENLSKLEGLNPVIDPNDKEGAKNQRINQLHKKYLFPIFDELKAKKSELNTCLDFGCGVGRNVSFLKSYFKEYIGADISSGMITKAQKDHKEKFVLLNGHEIPLPDQSIDVFFSFWVFQHIIEDKLFITTLKEARRILKPKCLIIFCERSSKAKNEEGKDELYINRRTPKDYLNLLKKENFSLKSIVKVDYKKTSFLNRLRKYNVEGENIYVFEKN